MRRRGPSRPRPACRSSPASASTRTRWRRPAGRAARPGQVPRPGHWRPARRSRRSARPRRPTPSRTRTRLAWRRRRPRRQGWRPHPGEPPASDPPSRDPKRARPTTPPGWRSRSPAAAAAAGDAAPGARPSVTAPTPTAPVVRPRSGSAPSGAIEGERFEGRRGPRAPVLVGLAVAGLAIVVLAVAAWLFLPSASIAVTPRAEPISVELTVSADPTVTTADPATGVVPAVRLDVPVEASQTFNTTGVHVEQTPAAGEVTFSNYNPVSSNTVPAGSIVSTEGGIRFRTLAGVTIPAGTFVLPNVIPSTRRVAVQAVKPGTEGNVPANAIRVVPQGENPDFLKVNNPNPTDGGTRTETPGDHAGRAGQGGRPARGPAPPDLRGHDRRRRRRPGRHDAVSRRRRSSGRPSRIRTRRPSSGRPSRPTTSPCRRRAP